VAYCCGLVGPSRRTAVLLFPTGAPSLLRLVVLAEDPPCDRPGWSNTHPPAAIRSFSWTHNSLAVLCCMGTLWVQVHELSVDL